MVALGGAPVSYERGTPEGPGRQVTRQPRQAQRVQDLQLNHRGTRGTSTTRNGRHKKQTVWGVSRFLKIKKRTPSVLGDFLNNQETDTERFRRGS